MRQKYGERVTTEFVNLATAENRKQYAAVLDSVEKNKLRLPLVAIDGEVKMAGGVDYYAIASAVEKALAAPVPVK